MTNRTIHSRIVTMVRCPACRKISPYDQDNPFRPFCCERCRLIDLGQWLEEGYRVAGDPASPEPPDEE